MEFSGAPSGAIWGLHVGEVPRGPNGERVARSDAPDRRAGTGGPKSRCFSSDLPSLGDLATFGKSLRSDEVRSRWGRPRLPTPVRRVYLDTVEVWPDIGFFVVNDQDSSVQNID
jgi:hypothetical protein